MSNYMLVEADTCPKNGKLSFNMLEVESKEDGSQMGVSQLQCLKDKQPRKLGCAHGNANCQEQVSSLALQMSSIPSVPFGKEKPCKVLPSNR